MNNDGGDAGADGSHDVELECFGELVVPDQNQGSGGGSLKRHTEE